MPDVIKYAVLCVLFIFISHFLFYVVAACGLAAGMPLNTTVAPFILRGVTLTGVDSVFMPVERRLSVYNKFGPILGSGKLDLLAGDGKTVGLSGVLELAKEMLKGNITGRYVVAVNY